MHVIRIIVLWLINCVHMFAQQPLDPNSSRAERVEGLLLGFPEDPSEIEDQTY